MGGTNKQALVIRLKGMNLLEPRTRKIFLLLRLSRANSATFLKLNKASANMLHRIEPYVAHGYPSRKNIRKLIYRRGFTKWGGNRHRLTTNSLVSRSLGNYQILTIEDLVQEIFTVGPHFAKANSFLLPFKLCSPIGGFVQKRKHLVEGGSSGNNEEKINKLINIMI